MKAILEQIRPPAEHSFASFQFANPRFDCPYHYHPEVELTLIASGYGQRLVGDHLGAFQAGDLVLMGANLPHSYFHSPGFDEGPQGARSIVIQFLPEFAGDFLAHAPECRTITRLIQKSRRGVVFSPETRRHAASRMVELVKTTGLRRMILFLEILQTLVQDRQMKLLTNEGFHPNFNEDQALRIQRVCAYLTEHFCHPIPLEAAAQIAHLTPPAFSRFFHRATNRTFTRFLNELRVSHACRLLLDTDKTVAEIAFESGFENLSNFNRQFQSMRETTPRQYRATQHRLGLTEPKAAI